MPYPYEFAHRWFPNDPCPTGGYHAVISKYVPESGRILDVGCGSNELLARHRTNRREVWGADFGRHPELKYADWFRLLLPDGGLPFGDASFDMVCSHMVMEHVNAPRQFLGEALRVLKPGGYYVGHSIHSRHYVTWIRRMFNFVSHRSVQLLVKSLYGREEHDTFPTHYRMNSQRALGRTAKDLGYEWIHWEQYANEGYFSFSPALVRAAVVVDWALEQTFPGLGRIYFTVALRKPATAAETVLARAA